MIVLGDSDSKGFDTPTTIQAVPDTVGSSSEDDVATLQQEVYVQQAKQNSRPADVDTCVKDWLVITAEVVAAVKKLNPKATGYKSPSALVEPPKSPAEILEECLGCTVLIYENPSGFCANKASLESLPEDAENLGMKIPKNKDDLIICSERVSLGIAVLAYREKKPNPQLLNKL